MTLGASEYQIDNAGTTKAIKAGDVVIAHAGETHGVVNTGVEPLIFISVV